jgi:hypothetical protein
MTKDSQRFLLFLWSQLVALLRWLVARWPRKSLAASPEKPSVQAASEASPKSDLLTEDAAVSSAPQDWIAKSYNAALDERRNDELKKDALVLATADLKAAFAALMLTKEIPLPVIVNYRFKWKRIHRLNRDIARNPAPSDLRLSRFRVRRCQPKAELLTLWKANS